MRPSPLLARRDAPARPRTEGLLVDMLLVGALVLFCALPFVLGDQPRSLVTPQATGIANREGDVVKQALLALVYLLTSSAFLVRADRALWTPVNALLLAVLLWAAASPLWADDSALAARRCVALAGTLVLGAYLAMRWSVEQLMQRLHAVAAVVLLGSFLLALAVPVLGLDPEGRLRGVFSNKNSLGAFAALALLNSTVHLLQRPHKLWRWVAVAVALGSVAAMVAANSMTPMLAAAVALVATAGAYRARSPFARGAVVAAVALLALIAVAFPWLVRAVASLAEWFGRQGDFSGRDLVWAFALEMLGRTPWTGFGYSTFWNGDAGLMFFRWSGFSVAHAHNGPLQLMLDIGVVGLLLALATLGALLLRLWRLDAAPPWLWLAGFTALLAVSNMTEPHLLVANDLYTVFFAYACVAAGRNPTMTTPERRP